MRSVLPFTLLLLCLVLTPRSAQADAASVLVPDGATYTAQQREADGRVHSVPVIVFDAQPAGAGSAPSAGFLTPTPSLRDGAPVELRVYNPNSFLNSYDLTYNGLDYHTPAMPTALSGLLSATHGGTRGTLPDLSELPLLQRDFTEFEAAYQAELGDDPANPSGHAGPLQKCLQYLIAAITAPGATNISIRAAAVTQVNFLITKGQSDPPKPQNSDTITGGHGDVSVVDFSPAQQTDLQALLTALRGLDTTPVAADNATLQQWHQAWEKDFIPQAGAGGEGAQRPDSAAPNGQARPESSALRTPAQDKEADAANDTIQQQMAEVSAIGDGAGLLSNLVALYAAAIDLSATPPYYVDRLDTVSGTDLVRFQVTVSGKPPTGNFAQVDVDNTRLGIPGAPSHGYAAEADVYGRTLLDFSAGIVVTTLTNRNYYGQAASSAAGAPKIIHQGASDSLDFSVGPLATLYKTQQSGIALGPTLGASGGNGTRYLLGLSLVSTIHHSRLLLTVGGASGNVAELANGDQVGKPANAGTISTNSVQRFGSFAALSWSLFTN